MRTHECIMKNFDNHPDNLPIADLTVFNTMLVELCDGLKSNHVEIYFSSISLGWVTQQLPSDAPSTMLLKEITYWTSKTKPSGLLMLRKRLIVKTQVNLMVGRVTLGHRQCPLIQKTHTHRQHIDDHHRLLWSQNPSATFGIEYARTWSHWHLVWESSHDATSNLAASTKPMRIKVTMLNSEKWGGSFKQIRLAISRKI